MATIRSTTCGLCKQPKRGTEVLTPTGRHIAYVCDSCDVRRCKCGTEVTDHHAPRCPSCKANLRVIAAP